MCGHYASRLPPEYIRGLFKTVGGVPNFAPNYILAPTENAMVVRRHPETGERRLDVLQWGRIPYYEKDPKGGRKPINARAETVTTSGMFKAAFARRRCLVPADAFYEWQKQPDGQSSLTPSPGPHAADLAGKPGGEHAAE